MHPLRLGTLALVVSVVSLAPGCPMPPPGPDPTLYVTTQPAHHDGVDDILEIADPETLAPGVTFEVERSCEGGPFEPLGVLTPGAPRLISARPTTVTAIDPWASARPLADALDATADAIEALGPVETCEADPTCAAELGTLLDRAQAESAEMLAALGIAPADPEDIGPSGDASVDVAHVDAALAPEGVWISVAPYGAWPPSDALESWYVIVDLFSDATAPRFARIVVQRHAGRRDQFYEGVTASDVVVLERPEGISFHVSADPTPTHVAVESGVMLTPTSPRVTDATPDGGARIAIADRRPAIDIRAHDCRHHAIGSDGRVLEFRDKPPTPRRYTDWNATVTDIIDPCYGKTPLQCYRDRLAFFRGLVCGQLLPNGMPNPTPPAMDDLPQPYRDMCRAIQEPMPWVTFAEPSCEVLDDGQTAGITRAGAPDDPPAGGHPMGRRSTVQLDVEDFVTAGCSYGTFVHELVHVIDNALVPDRVPIMQLEQRVAQLEAEVANREARMLLAARFRNVSAFGDERLRRDDAQRMLDMARLDLDRLRLARRFRGECHAYRVEIEGGVDLVPGLTGGRTSDQLTSLWQKITLLGFFSQAQGVLDIFRDGDTMTDLSLDDATRTEMCACVDSIRQAAMLEAVPATEMQPNLWVCAESMRPGGESVQDRYAALRARLMCP
jgi:hypothetical protein